MKYLKSFNESLSEKEIDLIEQITEKEIEKHYKLKNVTIYSGQYDTRYQITVLSYYGHTHTYKTWEIIVDKIMNELNKNKLGNFEIITIDDSGFKIREIKEVKKEINKKTIIEEPVPFVWVW